MVNHPNRYKHGFFLYKTPEKLSGVVRITEVIRLEEISADGASLRIYMKDGSVIESTTYDLPGFASQVLGDAEIEDLSQSTG